TGLIFAYGFTHFKLIDLLPVAKETVFNNLQDPVVVFDINKRLIELNKSAEDIFGLNGKEYIGKNAGELFHEYPDIIHSFQQGRSQVSFEIKTNKGSPRYFDVTHSKVIGKNQIPGYVLSFRDITERKKATNALVESEKQFHGIFEGVNDAVFLHEIETGKIVNANQKATEMYGYSKEELMKMSIVDLTADDQPLDLDTFTNAVKRIRRGLQKAVQWHAKGKSRNTFWVEVNPTILSFKGKEFLLVSVRDIDDKKKAEIRLKESEKKFRTFTESASIAIMIYQDDKWIYANPYAEKITGYSKNELLRMHFWDFIHPEYKDLIIKRGKARQRGEEPPSRYQFKILTKQEEEKWVDFRAEKIFFSGKQAVLITASDITDRKKSAETIDKQLTAIRSSMDGVAILNERGEFEYLNDAHVSIYGYDSSEELLGKSWRLLYNDEELKRFDEEIMPEFQKHGRWNGEAVGRKKDGTLFNQEITLTALEDGGLICVVRDITRQKMVVKELQDAHDILFTLNKDLERKVEQRTAQIQQLMKQKDDFINQLGHDLKTPLTPMMVLLPMLKKKVDSEKDNELFDVVIRNVYFMKDLVNKTIDLAKLNSDKIELVFESIDLSEETKNILSNNQVLFDEKNIAVHNHINQSIFVEADQLRLNEVLNNLITNAVKYSAKEGGEISLFAEEENEKVIVSIKDNGIGMTQDQINHIFDGFYKADESRHDLDSSGLGLTITKKIIKKHGGKIWAESNGPGKGTTFYFTLKKAEKKQIEQKEIIKEI
ncbi:MAG: PAS domain S-box protein, partial [Thermoplasmatota archaeon]